MSSHLGSVVSSVYAAFTLSKGWLLKRLGKKKTKNQSHLPVAMLKMYATVEHWLSFVSVHAVS